jgi:hypothetical protein
MNGKPGLYAFRMFVCREISRCQLFPSPLLFLKLKPIYCTGILPNLLDARAPVRGATVVTLTHLLCGFVAGDQPGANGQG